MTTMLRTIKIKICFQEDFGEGGYSGKKHNCEVKIMG
jgi:hypothetical protein